MREQDYGLWKLVSFVAFYDTEGIGICRSWTPVKGLSAKVSNCELTFNSINSQVIR